MQILPSSKLAAAAKAFSRLSWSCSCVWNKPSPHTHTHTGYTCIHYTLHSITLHYITLLTPHHIAYNSRTEENIHTHMNTCITCIHTHTHIYICRYTCCICACTYTSDLHLYAHMCVRARVNVCRSSTLLVCMTATAPQKPTTSGTTHAKPSDNKKPQLLSLHYTCHCRRYRRCCNSSLSLNLPVHLPKILNSKHNSNP